MPYVYLLHFNKPLSHAQHYCGFTPNGVEQRLAVHLAGNGARLVKAVVEAGREVEVARIWKHENWQEARSQERHLKRQHNGPRLCPICREVRKNGER